MTRLQMAGRAAATIMISCALFSGAAAAQNADTAPPRGLDFRLPPADDGRDSNVQGPSDNGLPPKQDAPKSVPAPKAVTPPVTPPKVQPTVSAPKAVPKAVPKAASPAETRPAPKTAAPVPSPVPMVVPVPQGGAATGSDGMDPTVLPPLTSDAAPTTGPNGELLPENNPAFLPSETDEPTAAETADQQGGSESPWWAWLVAGAIALGLAALYWRRQTAIRPEDYLDQTEPMAPTPPPAAPVAAPSVAAAAPSVAAAVKPAMPVPPVTPPAPAPVPQPASTAMRPNSAPQAAPSALSAPIPDAPRPAPRPVMPVPDSAPRAAPLSSPAPQAAADKAVPAWQNLDEYVSAGSLVRRPADEMRADVAMDMAVRSIRIEADHIAVGFILTLTNSGPRSATGLMVRIALGQGSAMHEAVLRRFYDGAGGSILRDDMELGAGRSEQLSSEVKLPRSSIEPMILGGKPLLVPVLAADITYHWDGEDDAFGQIAGAYVLGRAAVGGSEKLAPIPLDRAPLAVDRPGVRATEIIRRQ